VERAGHIEKFFSGDVSVRAAIAAESP